MSELELEELIAAILSAPVALEPAVRVECLNRETILRDKRIEMRIAERPIDEGHAALLLAQGYTWAP